MRHTPGGDCGRSVSMEHAIGVGRARFDYFGPARFQHWGTRSAGSGSSDVKARRSADSRRPTLGAPSRAAKHRGCRNCRPTTSRGPRRCRPVGSRWLRRSDARCAGLSRPQSRRIRATWASSRGRDHGARWRAGHRRAAEERAEPFDRWRCRNGDGLARRTRAANNSASGGLTCTGQEVFCVTAASDAWRS